MNFVKTNNVKIDNVQNFYSNLEDLLITSHGVSFHTYFIHKLLEEIYKSLNGLSLPIIAEIFIPKFSGCE